MKISEIQFDENLEAYILIASKSDMIKTTSNDGGVYISISDGLELAYEVITDSYKEKILQALELKSIWYELALKKIFEQTGEKDVSLSSIFLLSEQNDTDFVIGLDFRSEKYVEHGIGVKISVANMKILDIGGGEVAFC